MDYFYCETCERYYLEVFRAYHDAQHRYIMFQRETKNVLKNDDMKKK